MPNTDNDNDGIFDLQLIIDASIRDQSALLGYLQKQGLFDIAAPINGLYLPVDQAFAKQLGCAHHSENPHPSYREFMLLQLQQIEVSPNGQAAMEGDKITTELVIEAVWHLQATVRAGLCNGDLVLS